MLAWVGKQKLLIFFVTLRKFGVYYWEGNHVKNYVRVVALRICSELSRQIHSLNLILTGANECICYFCYSAFDICGELTSGVA